LPPDEKVLWWGKRVTTPIICLKENKTFEKKKKKKKGSWAKCFMIVPRVRTEIVGRGKTREGGV